MPFKPLRLRTNCSPSLRGFAHKNKARTKQERSRLHNGFRSDKKMGYILKRLVIHSSKTTLLIPFPQYTLVQQSFKVFLAGKALNRLKRYAHNCWTNIFVASLHLYKLCYFV